MGRNTSAELYIKRMKESIKHINRFFIEEEFNSALLKCIEEKKGIIEKGEKLFRARIYSESDRYLKYRNLKSDTWEGYNKKGSYINNGTNWNQEGRMNPAGIKYLYTATNIDICLAEIKPYAKTLISVAEIITKERLEIVDFSKGMGVQNTEWMAHFSQAIDRELSRGDMEEGDYTFTQYIAEFCRKMKYDGIAYSSSFGTKSEGKNITIFNYKKSEAIGSKLYLIDSIKVESHRVIPEN